MKRFFMLCSLLLLLGLSTWTQGQQVIISGTVTEQATGLPVVNHEVFIMSDSFNMVSYFNIEYTDNTGFYSDTIQVSPGNPGQPVMFYVSTPDCNGSMQFQFAWSNQSPITIDFQLCEWNQPICKAVFASTVDPVDPLTYYFNDFSLGNVVNWWWDFGDGNTANIQNPVHTYSAPGAYHVGLTIFTADSCTSTFDDYVYAGDSLIFNCYAHFFMLPDSNTYGFSFFDNSTISTSNWLWDFGDGTTSTAQNPSHVYANPGVYSVCLTITTLNGCTSTYCELAFVGNQWNCEAYFFTMPDPADPYTFQFTDLSSPNTISWNWDFGDGGFSTDQNPVHTYASPGMYEVKLYTLTSDSCFASYFEWVFPGDTGITNCYAMFSYIPDMSMLNGFFFQDLSSPDAISWFWDFGDGTSSNLQNPHHIFQGNGMYIVTLTITTATGCSSSFSLAVIVGNPWNCQAGFNSSPSPADPFTYQFTDASQGNVITWTWDFGDGNFSTVQNPVHTYNAPGWYPVTLTIGTMDSCWSSFTDYVTPGDSIFNCFADFSFFPDSSGMGFTFVDASFGGPVSWSWDFGDGTFGMGPFINHTYAQAGQYMVCLTIVTGSGCTNTHCYMVTVTGGGTFGNITGWVYADNQPLDAGYVVLYISDPFMGTAWPIDTVTIDSAGYYGFCCLPIVLGDFYVKAVPAPGSVYYSTHLPTYYQDAVFWADADPVNPDPAAGPYFIELVPVIPPAPGNGGIGGTITQGNKLFGSGAPVPDVEIMVLDMNNTPLMMDYSDQAGAFQFSNVPMGTYKVYAEVAFIPTTPAVVTLNSSNPVNNGIHIVYTPGGINTGIEDQPVAGLNLDITRVFPNPATDNMNLLLNTGRSGDISLVISDLQGRMILERPINLGIGEQMVSIPVSGFEPGMYLMHLTDADHQTKTLRISIVR